MKDWNIYAAIVVFLLWGIVVYKWDYMEKIMNYLKGKKKQ